MMAKRKRMTYLNLVERFELRPIRDDSALDAASNVYSALMIKGRKRSTDEEDYLTVLGYLIREYEEQYSVRTERISAREALTYLMEENKLSQTVLAQRIKVAPSVISEFLNGKRGLSKTVVMKLAKYFSVRPDLFLDA